MIMGHIHHKLVAGIVLAFMTCLGTATALALEPARDLAADSADFSQTGRPIMLLFTASDCPFCEAVKDGYFKHAAVDDSFTSRVMLREIIIDSVESMKDFSGKSANHGEFASRMGVDFVPQLMLLNGDGESLTKPVTGLVSLDWYGLYVERAIKSALDTLEGS